MFYFSLALFVVLSWCGPWWLAALSGVFFGWSNVRTSMSKRLQFSLAAGVSWSALAYVQDVRNAGQISRRLGGMMNLPHPLWLFVIMLALGFVTVLLCSQSGSALRRLFISSTD